MQKIKATNHQKQAIIGMQKLTTRTLELRTTLFFNEKGYNNKITKNFTKEKKNDGYKIYQIPTSYRYNLHLFYTMTNHFLFQMSTRIKFNLDDK